MTWSRHSIVRSVETAVEAVRRRGVVECGRRALDDPGKVVRHLRPTDVMAVPRHPVEGPPRPTEVEACGRATGHPGERAVDAWLDLQRTERFRGEILQKFWSTAHGPDTFYANWRDLLYVLVRLAEPDRVVETGVRGGLSSAYILQALAANGRGQLVSIDAGDTATLPPDLDRREVGWMVPARLTARWTLRLGDSRTLLPSVAAAGPVDMLFSDVPNDVLRDDLATACASMAPGTLVVTCLPAGSQAEAVWAEFAGDDIDHLATATRWETPDSRSDFVVGRLSA